LNNLKSDSLCAILQTTLRRGTGKISKISLLYTQRKRRPYAQHRALGPQSGWTFWKGENKSVALAGYRNHSSLVVEFVAQSPVHQ